MLNVPFARTVPSASSATANGLPGTSATAQAQIAASRVVLRDGEGEPADTFLESAPVHVLVIDRVEELIPETVRTGTTDIATLGFVGGFAVMMALDNVLG